MRRRPAPPLPKTTSSVDASRYSPHNLPHTANKVQGDRTAIVYGSRDHASDAAKTSWSRPLLIAVLLVSLAPLPLRAAAPVTTLPADQSLPERSLSSALQLLEDRDGHLDIVAVTKPTLDTGFVMGTPERANVGFSTSAWWVRFTLRNPGDQP